MLSLGSLIVCPTPSGDFDARCTSTSWLAIKIFWIGFAPPELGAGEPFSDLGTQPILRNMHFARDIELGRLGTSAEFFISSISLH